MVVGAENTLGGALPGWDLSARSNIPACGFTAAELKVLS